MTTVRPTRRIVFQGLGALGVAAALAGCGSGGETPAPESGAVLATTDEIPVGGGVVLSDEGVVLTQPTAGTIKAFVAICTHQGAALARVSDDGIECDLHGSRFSVQDGSATKGPATAALAEVPITVEGDRVLAA